MDRVPSKQEYVQLAEFRYRLRKFMHFSEEAARSVGITPQQHQLLLAVAGFPERDFATPTELAERLQLRHHSCLGLIQRCEQLGLVERERNPADKRSVLIHLTPAGKQLLDKLTVLHLSELGRLGLSHRNFLEKDPTQFDQSHTPRGHRS
ncbi:MarR family transcriptional regulator [Alicyclobacillus hesperidum subsp. aegles]|uniref:MarR family winged helix-turn-helix transcriptional regulator n=1 Tax=Alicyclobacillus hesperidum TaxID=89784 RepID=UPI00222D651C|nr:MarR family transcriptional regulator [Alicyclobacillus hesperidum]GLG02323.1 MarR family transcriptional regulator [Alicyclobacillus hesperidum subsp. aegles]